MATSEFRQVGKNGEGTLRGSKSVHSCRKAGNHESGWLAQGDVMG